MSGDEEDYMSEAFLAKCAPEGNDARPGLIKEYSARRHHELMKRKCEHAEKNKAKSVKVIEAQRREEGLKESISSNNKGFTMLQKMGYKEGQGIGKQCTGRSEPIPINIKNDRSGLGRESVRIEIAKRREIKRLSQQSEVISIDDFRRRLGSKMQERHNADDLSKSQRICRTFDIELGCTEPDEVWFWPEAVRETNEEEEDEAVNEMNEEFEVSEKLDLLTSYLRQEHFYCIWCAVRFDSYEDLTENCPGNRRQDH